jgi:mannose-6-phosphate isomerase-like protein (cupin superfamily)
MGQKSLPRHPLPFSAYNPGMPLVPGSLNSEYWFREGCYITEWSNSAADEDLSVARARVEPGQTTRWHRLAGTTERYVILEGRGRAEVGDELIDVIAGDVVIIPLDQFQRITNTGDTDLVFLAICTPRFQPENYREIPEMETSA